MRVLAHIHTFNDADIIDRTIAAVRRQTRPVDDILVVDNASTDGTLDRPSLQYAKIIRHAENLGTSGTVITGMRYALGHGFDWIWVFDADSEPQPEALRTLLDFYAGLQPELRAQIACLACLPYNQVDGQPLHGSCATRFGRVIVSPPPDRRYYAFDVTVWSGSLYRVEAIRRIGLPNPDYVLDWGEYEYGYRVARAGYKSFIHQDAVMKHNIRGVQSLQPFRVSLRPLAVTFYEDPPIRCYYVCRNTLYFMIYENDDGPPGLWRAPLWRVRPAPGRPGLMRGVVWQLLFFLLNFMLRPHTHMAQIRACCRGIWHGVTGNIAIRY